MPVSARYAPEDQAPASKAGPGTLNLVPKSMGPRTLRLVPSWDPGPGTRLVPTDHGSWNPALGAQLKTRVLEQECDCLEPYGPANNKGQEPLRCEPAGASHLCLQACKTRSRVRHAALLKRPLQTSSTDVAP
jgi:hypothetical protein